MKNGFFVIDSHCHIYPEKIASKAVAGTDTFYGTVAKCDGTARSLMQINEEMYKVAGESVLGADGHAEFIVDETALYELILSVFYRPVDG